MEAQERAAREEALRSQQQQRVIETSETAQPMTSSEFDQFLSDRATMGSQSVSTQPTGSSSRPRAVQMTNVISGEGKSDDREMFGL